MSQDILFERDVLYPTSHSLEPGSIHVQVFGPDKNARIPVVIESKTDHSPIKYLDTIVRILQSDIFDRVFIDIKKNVTLFIKVNDDLTKEYGNHNHIMVHFTEDGFRSEGVDR